MFVPLLEILFNHCMEQETISQRFARGVVKLLCKSKQGGNGISNLRCLTDKDVGQSPGKSFAGCDLSSHIS